MHTMDRKTARALVLGYPHSFDAAIAAAMANAYDMGLREDDDDDGEAFRREVLRQVTS